MPGVPPNQPLGEREGTPRPSGILGQLSLTCSSPPSCRCPPGHIGQGRRPRAVGRQGGLCPVPGARCRPLGGRAAAPGPPEPVSRGSRACVRCRGCVRAAVQALRAESANLPLIKPALCNITYMSLHLTPIIVRKAQALFQPLGLRASGADLPGTRNCRGRNLDAFLCGFFPLLERHNGALHE